MPKNRKKPADIAVSAWVQTTQAGRKEAVSQGHALVRTPCPKAFQALILS